MKKRADFYLLNQTEKESSYRWACQLIYTAWKENKSVYVFCENETEAKIMDDMLWTFKDISFIPHQLMTEPVQSSLIRILIGYYAAPVSPPVAQMLLNLSQTTPEFFENYSHIIEVVPQEPKERENARKSYKAYKQAHYECVTHQDEV
jgi:DNA polymerase-3 subunit chi